MTFAKLRTRDIPAMQAQVQEYEDPASGARHIHLASDRPDMVFLVGLPTVPDASDGRAHILEHLALCGSARYPVRDPFFAMLRRSTAHFMNAMTYSDKTVYPFATTGKTDFFNLLDVYLDAVFFPRLDYLDFLQEGWRLAVEGEQLSYQGIVFNEMKGAFADPMRAVDHGISSHLLKGTTYEVESGGDPLDIPRLTHAALKAFHAAHYHPSQAVFMTAGRVDPQEVQHIIDERVLSRLPGRMPRKLPQLAQPWTMPKDVAIHVPSLEYGMQFSWLMGETADPAAHYHAQLLEAGLLSNASAPLTHAMESAGFGRPSQMNGADTDRRQIIFHLGMEGLTREQVGAARGRIWSALERTAKQGVPLPLLQAALRDIRFDQQEISGGYAPDLLNRLLHAMPFEMYGGDIMNGFDEEAIVQRLQRDILDPAFFKGLAQGLLESTTRLDSTIIPDADYFQVRNKIEEERLAALAASLAEPEKDRLRSESAALLERQRQPVNNDALPRIRPQDVSPLPRPPLPLPADGKGVIAVSIPSNGISYASVVFDVSAMEEEAWPWLQLYVEVLTDLGVGNKSYEEADAWRYQLVPVFNVELHALQTQAAARPLRLHIEFHAKGLREENRGIATVLSESIRAARFDERERLAFLIDSMVQDMRNELAEDGDEYARLSATAPLSPMRNFENSIKGTASLSFYRELHRKSQTAAGIDEICQRLSGLHQRIIGAPASVITAGMEHDGRELGELIELPPGVMTDKRPGEQLDQTASAPQGMLGNSALHAAAQVNHCFAAWAAPGLSHHHAPALSVLAELLTNLVLHQALREEGGAYGGHAGYSPSIGAFVMRSYRDPRLAATYEDFERAIAWVMTAELKQENIEEAIICVIQDLDKPRTPYADVAWAWEQQQQGITEDMRRRHRDGVLHCTGEAIKAAAAAWLVGKPYSRAAFVGNMDQDLAGLESVDLMKLVS